VGHQIVQVFGVPDPPASNLIDRLDHLFQLRNDAVHFESVWRDGLHSHPIGKRTSYELTVYTLERAEAAVGLLQNVFETIRDSAGESRHDAAAQQVASGFKGILEMMAEVRSIEAV
jgi:hypothetical protein